MKFLAIYTPSYIVSLVYMLQSSEYHLVNYVKWYWRTSDFNSIMYRRRIDYTRKATLLVASAMVLRIIQYFAIIYLMSQSFSESRIDFGAFGLGWLLLEPVLTAHLLILPLSLGSALIQQPKTEAMINRARNVYASHPGVTIAVAGSYGKTSTKEILSTVLSKKLKVAATQANLNTPIALSRFANNLDGDEDVVIIELGEFKPGDIADFANLIHPDSAVITGLTEAHMDTLKDLDTAAANLLSLADFVSEEALFISSDSHKLAKFTANLPHVAYGASGTMDWKITDVETSLDGTKFIAKKDKTKINAHSNILGTHMVGVLGLAIGLAKEFGLSKKQIEAGISETVAFEHRMQLLRNDDVVIIDDTYNGNIEGVTAAVEFVAGLGSAKRKVYVTPGLVEMADETEDIHKQLGKIVAPVFDEVVIMKNNQTDAIVEGLKSEGFIGEMTIVEDPLAFYNNLESFTSAGDVILMQNDLTDNYS